jgi:hypothetical protein
VGTGTRGVTLALPYPIHCEFAFVPMQEVGRQSSDLMRSQSVLVISLVNFGRREHRRTDSHPQARTRNEAHGVTFGDFPLAGNVCSRFKNGEGCFGLYPPDSGGEIVPNFVPNTEPDGVGLFVLSRH